jgi:pyridoxamine 5'-phosphate oxidase
MWRFADLREEYTRGGLLESEAADDPFAQVHTWIGEAETAGVAEWNAMALATSTLSGIPSVRIVLLKGIDTGFVFYTNYESRKGQDLIANPHAALCLYWKELERQIRITGRVERTSREESLQYFHSRPSGSQIGAWSSRQSQPVESRAVLEADFAKCSEEFRAGDVPLPDFWGGFRLLPDAVEFWQGRANRLHDRLEYRRIASGWLRQRLSP